VTGSVAEVLVRGTTRHWPIFRNAERVDAATQTELANAEELSAAKHLPRVCVYFLGQPHQSPLRSYEAPTRSLKSFALSSPARRRRMRHRRVLSSLLSLPA